MRYENDPKILHTCMILSKHNKERKQFGKKNKNKNKKHTTCSQNPRKQKQKNQFIQELKMLAMYTMQDSIRK